MSISKHTPGPWKYDDMNAHYAHVLVPGKDIARVDMTQPNAEADLCLIACAPDLLAMCKGAMLFVASHAHALPPDQAKGMLEMLRMTIAKAEGKE